MNFDFTEDERELMLNAIYEHIKSIKMMKIVSCPKSKSSFANDVFGSLCSLQRRSEALYEKIKSAT